jgi:hypothetical protein
VSMDTNWQAEFRKRMNRFGVTKADGLTPVSIKVRVESGCFHREHSPEAYRLIDDHCARAELSDIQYQIEEHESGPEILVYLAVTAAGFGLAKSIVELITAMIKARSEGIKRGDKPSHPLELIVRGHSRQGEYFEEKILRIPLDQIITAKEIEDAFSMQTGKAQKKSRKKK